MIVQELIAIQDRLGWLPEEELRDLAHRLEVPLHRIHEVASFYPHYRLQPPPDVTVRVCRDMACHIRGGPRLQAGLEAFGNEQGPSRVRVEGVSCLGQCDCAPSAVTINDHPYWGLTDNDLQQRILAALDRQKLPHQHRDRSSLGWKIDPYGGKPKYEALRKYVADRNVDALLGEMETAGLVGMGGAGFPTHRKWRFVRAAAGDEKFIVCNADESEPGTFKDREILRRTPYLTIEGMVLAALVTGARKGWIYLRHEYHDELEACRAALLNAYEQKVLGDDILGTGHPFHLEMYISPGGYIQGEESALLEAMEDRRGEPRNKPPFPVTNGLFDKPTVINNVETLAWVPGIVVHGGAWYRDGGVNGAKGMRFVSISGDVARPGVYEVPFGQTVRDLVLKTAGGMADGMGLKAIAPSGPSGGFLPARIPTAALDEKFVKEKLPPGAPGLDILDLPLDPNSVRAVGSMLGAAFVVYGDRRDMVEQALNCVSFFRNESCGKCVPCRIGSEKLVELIEGMLRGEGSRAQLPMVGDLAQTMTLASICGLGQVAANPMASVVKFFPEDLAKHLRT